MIGTVFFSAFAFLAVVGALSVVLARSPIRSAVALLVTIVGIAALFLKLEAQFLAAIQLIVYAGAVVVLFVFVIMLLGPEQGAEQGVEPPKARLSRAIAAVLVLATAAGGLVLMAMADLGGGGFGAVGADHGTTEAVGKLVFTKGLVPFELATALLIVAAIGAIAVARGKPVKARKPALGNETKRLFGGPVHPRDAEHPSPEATAVPSAAPEVQLTGSADSVAHTGSGSPNPGGPDGSGGSGPGGSGPGGSGAGGAGGASPAPGGNKEVA